MCTCEHKRTRWFAGDKLCVVCVGWMAGRQVGTREVANLGLEPSSQD